MKPPTDTVSLSVEGLDIPESGRLDETYYRDGTSFLNSKYKTDFESEAATDKG